MVGFFPPPSPFVLFPASPFLGSSPVSSHRTREREKKKRSRMFGKICRSVEHSLHLCTGNQGGRFLRSPLATHRPRPALPEPSARRGEASAGFPFPLPDPFCAPASGLGSHPPSPVLCRERRASGGGSRRGRATAVAAASRRGRDCPWARGAGRAPPAPPAEGAGRRPGGGGRRGEAAAAGGDEVPAERMPPPRPPGSNFADNYRPRNPRASPASPGRASNLMPQREPQPAAPPVPGLLPTPQHPRLLAASRCPRSPWPRRAWVPRRPGRRQRGMRRPRAP